MRCFHRQFSYLWVLAAAGVLISSANATAVPYVVDPTVGPIAQDALGASFACSLAACALVYVTEGAKLL